MEEYENENKWSNVDDRAIPINADIRTYDFDLLSRTQVKICDKLFDAVMMDPPWQLSTSTPSRGVAIAYDSLNDEIIT